MSKIKFVLLVSLLSISLYASQKVNVFILHSYSQEYEWTKKQYEGFIKTLEGSDTRNFEYSSEYLDTKRIAFTSQYQKHFLNYLKIKYKNLSPDIIYVTDDNALLFIYKYYNEIFTTQKNAPVFFSGVNNLQMENVLPKEVFRGVYEVKEIEPNIQLIKQFSPQTRDIYFIGDDSNTYKSIKRELEIQHKKFSNLSFHYISDKYLSNVITDLPQKPRSFVLLTTIGEFKDDNNKALLPVESIQKIRENKNLVILSMEDAYMKSGVVGGYLTSGIKQGENCARLVLQYLKDNSLESVQSITKSPNIYFFNAKELSNSRVILSEYIARNATIIAKQKDAESENLSIVLNIIIVVMIFLFFMMIFLYALQRRRYLLHKDKASEIESLKTKLYIRDQLISNTYKLGNIGYWRLKVEKNELFISKELIAFLEIDINVYENDSQLLEYFIHPNDKKSFNEMLANLKNVNEPLQMKHKMISSRKSVFNVEHLVYREYYGDKLPYSIVGIIKFEKS